MKMLLASAALVASTLYARSEQPIRLERVVPPGATLTYAVDGVPVNTIRVPEGRVTVIITYGGSIAVGHGRGVRR